MANTINLKQYPNFLTEEHCKMIIAEGEPMLQPAGILGTQYNDFRVAETTGFNTDLKAFRKIREVIAQKTGLPIENQEPMSLIKYEVGGQFKPHHDAFHPNTDYYEGTMRQGGQRVKTCLIYLNENFEGGQTEFPRMGYKVQPKTGLMIIWDNTDPNKNIIMESEHAGLPITKGVKYLVSIWIRESLFKNIPLN